MTQLDQTGGDRVIYRCLLGLTVVTGVVDAVSFLRLGHIFTANMTGNVVFLGFALAGETEISAARSSTALASFACGGFLGGRISAKVGASTQSLLIAMTIETALLLCSAAGASLERSHSSTALVYPVLVLMAIAMGVRNAVVRRLGVRDLTTTVLTMTITGLAADSQLGGGRGDRSRARMLPILMMGAGAFGGALVLRAFGLAAALAAAAVFVAALAMYVIARRRTQADIEPAS